MSVFSIETLVADNAKSAQQIHGTPVLTAASGDEAARRLRYHSLWRSLYPQHAPSLAKAEAQRNKSPTTTFPATSPAVSSALITTEAHGGGTKPLLPLALASSSSGASSSLLQKRTREGVAGDGNVDIIRVNPRALKEQHTLVVSAAAAEEARQRAYTPPAKWRIAKVLVGHQGWVWAAAVDPTNSWFATGSFDSVIKVWDLSTGALKMNMTGHKEAVRSIALSRLSPYMFSGSDDHSVKCWDLTRNEIIRDFFGHKSAVHCVAAHPLLDVIVSGGRDNTVRVWDIRSRKAVHTFIGHTDSVMSIIAQDVDPQVISGGNDGFIYMWDLAAGKPLVSLTRHKKPVRGLAMSSSGRSLVSCGADEVRVWDLPSGSFVCNASTVAAHETVSNSGAAPEELAYRWSCCAMSSRDVLSVCSQDGHIGMYDWAQPQPTTTNLKHYAPFQVTKTKSIPGTLLGEGGINCVAYDVSGTRMITAESDKSIKIWRMREH